MKKKIKNIISVILCVLTIFSCFPVIALADTSVATEIDSTFLFEKSTLDDLKLNFNTMPAIEVSGLSSSQYEISDSNQLWWWTEKNVKNRRIEFDNDALKFDSHYPNLKLTVTFSNCGTLDGKDVDIVLTYSDFWTSTETGSQRYDTKTLWWTAYGTPEQQTSENEWFMVGFSKFNFDIKFKYHDSDSFINIDNAYFTLYSMDGGSSGDMMTHAEAASSNTASNAYWYKERNMSYISTYNNGLYSVKNMYYGVKSHTSGNRDTKNALCFQYENQDSINLDMIVAYGLWSEGYHVNFTPLTAVVPEEPVKSFSVNKITENSNVDCTIVQSLPESYDDDFYLKSFEIEDALDDSLNYVSASLTDENGKDITSTAGILDYVDSTNTVTYSFDSDYLKNVDYNGQDVVLKISVNAESGIDKDVVTNTAMTSINDKTYSLKSNTISLGVYYPVTVNYVDENGNKLLDSYSFDCFVGESYETEERNISNYVLTEIPSNAEGEIENSPITVDYVYRPKDTFVTVKYVDEEGNLLADDIVVNGRVFDTYVSDEKLFEGYELTTYPTNASGTMTENPITVTYVYRLKDTSVVVKYVDDEGNSLSDDIIINGKVFDSYSTEQKSFSGYKLVEEPDNASGTMTEGVITVTYVYTKKDAVVISNYIDEQGLNISDSVVTVGKVNDEYTTSAKDIYGYELISIPPNANGMMTEESIVVDYIYRLKDTSVTVNYLTEDGTVLGSSVKIVGKVFDIYNTENKRFIGYELIAIPDNASGTMTEEPIVVNYIYKLRDTSVLVNYITSDGKQLADSIIIGGKVFDAYNTESKSFYGYELITVPDNAEGDMAETQIVVNYIYKLKTSSVMTYYVDENGDEIEDSVLIEGNVFDEYQTVSKNIYGYELVETPDNATGEMTEDQITVTYVYKLKDTSVVVRYLTDTNKQLCDDIIINGKVFDDYKTEEKSFYGYSLIESPANAKGRMTENQIEVIYVYSLNSSSVIVNYVDVDGHKLAESVAINGHVFDKYNTENKAIYGYTLIKVPDNASGTMTDGQITVDYVYELKETSVLVNYVTDGGDKLTDSIVLVGKVFDEYTTENKTFYGYSLISVPDNVSGTMTEEQISVDYIYRLKNTSVIVNYVDENGNALSDSVIINGRVFDEYDTENKDIYGYTLKAVPDNASGTMTEDTIVVNYVYSLNDAFVYVDYLTNNGLKLQDTVIISGKVFDKYNTEEKSFYGYYLSSTSNNLIGIMQNKPISVNYIYTLKDTSVIVNYITDTGETLDDSIIMNGKVFDDYNTEAKSFYGYSLVEMPANADGIMTEDIITVNYVYKLKSTSVVVNYVDEDGNKLADSVTLNGKVFDDYTTTDKNIYGYNLIGIPDNADGEMTEDVIIVDYVYCLRDTSVIVNYLDDNNNQLMDSIEIDGKVFDKYVTENKTFYGYDLVAIPDNSMGVMAEAQIVVNYVYKLKATSVLVNYVSSNGKNLCDSVAINGKVFDDYRTEERSFYGYELTETPKNADGKMTEEQIVVDYVYTLRPAAVNVHYVDTEGKDILDEVLIKGNVFDEYTTQIEDIYGYVLVEKPDNVSGIMTEDDIIVNYVYTLKSAVVNVNYVDTEGMMIAEAEIINGKVFDEYKTKSKDIDGYRIKQRPDNATGTMTEEPIMVNYVYEKLPEADVPYTGDTTVKTEVIFLCVVFFMLFFNILLLALPKIKKSI